MSIEELESLADGIVAAEQAKHEKLARLIAAYCRILRARAPETFARQAVGAGDVDGHWDNSYPPDQVRKDFTGPALYEIIAGSEDIVATSEGFYHDVRFFTEDTGLYVDPAGRLYGRTITGTGRFGQFAAHPGYCHVEQELDYSAIDRDDVPLDRLVKAERELRALAFPLTGADYTVTLA